MQISHTWLLLWWLWFRCSLTTPKSNTQNTTVTKTTPCVGHSSILEEMGERLTSEPPTCWRMQDSYTNCTMDHVNNTKGRSQHVLHEGNLVKTVWFRCSLMLMISKAPLQRVDGIGSLGLWYIIPRLSDCVSFLYHNVIDLYTAVPRWKYSAMALTTYFAHDMLCII